MANIQQVEHAAEHGYEFSISTYFSRGYESFKERVGEYIGYTVAYLVISVILSFIPIVGQLISLAIAGPLSLAYAIFTHRLHTNQSTEFSNFFDGFKKFGSLFATYILQVIIYMIIMLPAIFIIGFSFFMNMASGDKEAILDSMDLIAANSILFLILIVMFIYVAISLRWSLHLNYFYDYSPVDAIKQSFRLVNKNWFAHFAFVFLSNLVQILGVLALLFGLLVAIPVIWAADYHGFADVTGLGKEDDDVSYKSNYDELV